MGYFSNGTEGYEYQAKYCDRCKNWRDTKKAGGPGCPIIGRCGVLPFQSSTRRTP